MKLWQKIFLYTLMLVMLAVGVTSILLLKNSFSLAMDQKKQASFSEHEFLITNFKSLILSERLRQNVILLEPSAVAGYMEDTFDEENMKSGIAFYDKNRDSVYQNFTTEGVEEILKVVGESGETYMQIINGRLYIVSRETIETNTYYFVTASNMNDVLSMHSRMLDDIQIIGMVCAVAIAVVLLVVVKLLLMPLQKINEGTRDIAQGEYHRRVPERGRDEISELAHNMNKMAVSVERNVKALEDVAEDRKIFIANLSHELKTPLTSILGFADLLRIKREISEKDRLEYASIIMEEARRLRTLSGKLMEMTTVGESNVDWEELDMENLFSEMGISLGVVAEKHEMQLECESESGLLNVDRELMKSLVYNLADNAMKASAQGDVIKIRGSFQGASFYFTVSDEGIGIPKEEIEKITQAFYMVDKARSRARGGAGLGMSLCLEIAAMHRGTIQIESKPGKGTIVTVCLKGGEKIASDESDERNDSCKAD